MRPAPTPPRADPTPPPASSRGARLLLAVVALLVGVGSGVALAGFPTDPPARLTAAAATGASSPAPTSAAAEAAGLEADMRRGAEVAAGLVTSLRVQLPRPEDVPEDAYAPTPEIHHGILHLPSIGVSQPLFEGVTLTAINRGPSLWPGAALPGELGNVVVAGHRTTYTRPFWDLDLLQPGDELIFELHDGSRHVYTLDRTEVVDETDIHIIDQSYGYRATLFACHPKGSARQRIVGHFTLAESGDRQSVDLAAPAE
jgi:sortase A